MFVEDTKENLIRRMHETLGYAKKVEGLCPLLAETLRREALWVEAALPSLNREGIIQSSGLLHGLCAATVVLIEELATPRTK